MRTQTLAIRGGEPVCGELLPEWPILDERRQCAIVERILADRASVVPRGRVPLTAKRELEARFAALCGARFALAVNSGTTALDLAFAALGVRSERIVVAANYGHPASVRRAATTNPLLLLDVDPGSLCLDTVELHRALDHHDVGAVIVTHFAGRPAAIREIAEMCARSSVPLIEDCSHAHGVHSGDAMVGAFGMFGCFSLHASKNVSAGEGGLITTGDELLHRLLWLQHDLGRGAGATPYDFVALGGNYRMSNANAAIALVVLDDLASQNAARAREVEYLRDALPPDSPVELLPPAPLGDSHGYHIVAGRYRLEHCGGLSRHRFILSLCAEGILCNAGWPQPLSAVSPLAAALVPHATPVATCACADSIWFDQRLFLSVGGGAMVARAIEKVTRLGSPRR